MSTSTFSTGEIGVALFGALAVQGAFLALLVLAGNSRGAIREEKVEEPIEIPIAVQPVLDESEYLKLGSDKKPRLPDMWKKREPVPVKRYEERSAPSADAEDNPDKIPESELADKKHEAPPEDAELIEKTDQDLEDPDEKTEAPELDEEGAADGIEGGKETDPLKARQIDQYRLKIAGWFNARFSAPSSIAGISCEQLKKLSASLSVQVGPSRNITGFQMTSPSGNASFDAKVQATLSALVGQQLPPPPPLYPDILGGIVSPRLSGGGAQCTPSATPAAESDEAPAESPEPAPAPSEE